MALLNKKQREKRFKALGIGNYNKTNIKKFQRAAFSKSKFITGEYNKVTDRALRHWYNVRHYTKSFKPEEFKCTCGHCSGYPSYMKRVELINLQKIRDHYNKPMNITCGLRCKYANSTSKGSIDNSLHRVGRASDFYIKGVTDTLAGRKKLINWAKTLPNTHYIYCDGYNNKGYRVKAPYMENSIHYDVNKIVPKQEDPLQKWYDTLKIQSDWSKNAKYQWVNPPTVANSKFKKTCIALPCVSLQRLDIFPKGGWFYLGLKDGKINGPQASYMKKHPEIFEIQYPNKSVVSLGSKIKKGDIVAYTGGRGHIMVYMGKNVKGQHIFATGGHVNSMAWVSSYFAKRPIKMLVRLKKV